MIDLRISRTGRLLGAGLLCCVAACNTADADRSEAGAYKPAQDVPRLGGAPLAGDDIGIVRDFDVAGDTIYLLDGTGRIVLVENADAGLRLLSHIGRRGGGPGEFMQPTGLAMVDGSVAVMDGTRAQFFDVTGALHASKQITLPCPMLQPSIAPASDGLFIHGACMRRGVATDTMTAMLAWSTDTTTWEIIATAPRFTTDGSLGSIFGSRSLLTTGSDRRHAFGGGETNCIWIVTDTGGRPAAAERCPAVAVLYSADPPPELARRLKAGRIGAMGLSWPETLPPYVERFVAGNEHILVRPFSPDSVVLQTAAGRDLAVAPLDGLIGCKSGGCLWLLEDSDVPHLIFVNRASLESMLEIGDA